MMGGHVIAAAGWTGTEPERARARSCSVPPLEQSDRHTDDRAERGSQGNPDPQALPIEMIAKGEARAKKSPQNCPFQHASHHLNSLKPKNAEQEVIEATEKCKSTFDS
jgi:hypothetical protein